MVLVDTSVWRNVALAAADSYRTLRRRGIGVRKTIRVIIGAFCIVNDHELLHSDRDFDPMEEALRIAHLQGNALKWQNVSRALARTRRPLYCFQGSPKQGS